MQEIVRNLRLNTIQAKETTISFLVLMTLISLLNGHALFKWGLLEGWVSSDKFILVYCLKKDDIFTVKLINYNCRKVLLF